eukprot:5782758-Heterocapsa_arctica.AAC.1
MAFWPNQTTTVPSVVPPPTYGIGPQPAPHGGRGLALGADASRVTTSARRDRASDYPTDPRGEGPG